MSKEDNTRLEEARGLSVQELASYAGRFVQDLPQGGGASVITLSGELGAGKTQFAKAAASALGVTANVTSPTFLIMKSYPVPSGRYKRLYHLDCYRITSAQEVRALGWDEIIAKPDHLVIVEWGERIAELIPSSALRLRLEIAKEDTRDVLIQT